MPRAYRAISTAAILLAFVLMPAAAQAQGAPPSLTGTWRFTVTSDAGSGTPTVTLKQQGDTLTGSYSSQVFGEQQLKGTVKDKEFSFEFTAALQGTSLTVTYKGTIASADSLQGTINFGGMGNGTFTAKRQPPAQPQQLGLRSGRSPILARVARPARARHYQG